ncbi:MAG: SDR family oxidoreductase [Anaerolineales bacterium]|nr:SDR family oxidoreductase [Anaerolineales bacterium]
MNLNITGKTALVTGASSGIGAATARVLAEEGANVIVSYGKNRTGATQVTKEIEALGGKVWLHQMDICNAREVADAIQAIKPEIPGLDILISCSGQTIDTPFMEVSPIEWEQIVNVNLNGPFYVLQAARELFNEQASVVLVASVAAHTGVPHHAHYAAAKAGLVNLTKSAARALAPQVRVNCVAPGITLTPMGQRTINTIEDGYAKKKLLVQRFATPEEIARCVTFIASPLTGFMTGSTLDINGGRYLR